MEILSILKEIKTEEERYKMQYVLVEFQDPENMTEKAYGFKLKQYMVDQKNQQDVEVSSVETDCVFDDYKAALRFFHLIIEESVFPETLIYHIDDWFCAFQSK